MEQAFKKSKLFLIVAGLSMILGIAAFVVAYGISDGWEAVGAWFTSKYAILLYIGIGLYALVVIALFITDWIKKL